MMERGKTRRNQSEIVFEEREGQFWSASHNSRLPMALALARTAQRNFSERPLFPLGKLDRLGKRFHEHAPERLHSCNDRKTEEDADHAIFDRRRAALIL